MINETLFSGLNTCQSPYTVPDGSLDTAINVINQDGAIRPLLPPRLMARLPQGTLAAYIHQLPDGRRNLIIITQFTSTSGSKEYSIYWCPFSDDTPDDVLDLTDVTPIGILDMCPVAFSPMGNIFSLVFDGSPLRYCRWRDNGYILLDAVPPFVSITFGLRGGYLSDGLKDKTIPKPPKSLVDYLQSIKDPTNTANGRRSLHPADADEKVSYQSVVDSIYGEMLRLYHDEVTSRGAFSHPFFVRYALRMFDGSYICHSAPVLMFPDVIRPIYAIGEIRDTNADSIRFFRELRIPRFNLYHQNLIDSTALRRLADWEDIITAIDIFVSAPIYTFNQSPDTNAALTFCPVRTYLGSGLETFYDKKTPTVIDPDDHVGTPTTSGGRAPRPGSSAESGSTASSEGGTSGSRADATASARYFMGDFFGTDKSLTFFNNEYRPTTPGTPCWGDKFLSVPEGVDFQVIDLPVNEKFHDQIRDVANFYHIATIPFSDIRPASVMSELILIDEDLTNLVAKKTLPDDFQSHFTISPNGLHTYNSRLNIFNLSITPPSLLPVPSTVPRQPASDSGSTTATAAVTVWSVHAQTNIVRRSVSPWPYAADRFPRYLFVPDPEARKIMIEIGDQRHCFSLTTHTHLNGAYWYGGVGESSTPPVEPSGSVDSSSHYVVANTLYLSGVNNPFIFPASHVVSVGSGSILALASAARPLSTGQFGDFPLYAFTTEGVWALSVGSSGEYISRQPISRETILSPHALCPLDSSVVFATRQGVMHIAGSEVTNLSPDLNQGETHSIHALPSADKAIAATHQFPDISVSFIRYITQAHITYDYPRQRVIVFNPRYGYAYIYSLQSGAWSVEESTLHAPVNSYPSCIAISKSVDANDSIPAPELTMTLPPLTDKIISDHLAEKSGEAYIETAPVSYTMQCSAGISGGTYVGILVVRSEFGGVTTDDAFPNQVIKITQRSPATVRFDLSQLALNPLGMDFIDTEYSLDETTGTITYNTTVDNTTVDNTDYNAEFSATESYDRHLTINITAQFTTGHIFYITFNSRIDNPDLPDNPDNPDNPDVPDVPQPSSSLSLVDLSTSDATSAPVLLVTRPLKLDNPDLLKTVSTLIVRGDFARGHLAIILYASRDLIHWLPVWSSQDHYLRGFSGTSYKYFRLVVLGHIDRQESITSFTTQFTPKFTNHLR